ncbi:hypothetical protein EZV62_027157 [Acer yangbiense]|uniref:Uncharacterized protein n=1 Tax=Acer yangbiense TaxID=1000413 RepID=A0A5C7GTB4_9ROSI|nr:hypothetical protein EZV62_027157 [Acer yangbiense]
MFNVDGSVKKSPNAAGIGGVLRDSSGKILGLFSSFVGCMDANSTKNFAIHRACMLLANVLEGLHWFLRLCGSCLVLKTGSFSVFWGFSSLVLFCFVLFCWASASLVLYCLRLEVARSKARIVISQSKYTLEILNDVGFLGVQPIDFPMEQNLKLTNNQGDLLLNPSRYRRLIVQLIYLPITRPNITYSMNILSQFMYAPRKPYWDAALHSPHCESILRGHDKSTPSIAPSIQPPSSR